MPPPPDASLEWSDAGVEGAHRFLRRLWKFAATFAMRTDAALAQPAATAVAHAGNSKKLEAIRFELHSILKQANIDYARNQFNTVVSACMKLLNLLESDKFEFDVADEADRAGINRQFLFATAEALSVVVRLLYPVTPHIGHALWQELSPRLSALLGRPVQSLDREGWPQHDDKALVQSEIELVVQVNGKLRGKITVAADADQATIETTALANADVQRFMEGKPAKKVIVVKGKLVNIVV